MSDYEEVMKQIENLDKEDFENLKIRVCSKEKCEIERGEKGLKQIVPQKIVQKNIAENKNLELDNHEKSPYKLPYDTQMAYSAKIKNKTDKEVGKMPNEQNIDTKIMDLSEKYRNRIDSNVSKYNANTLISTLNQVGKVDKKMTDFHNKVIINEVPVKDRFAYKVKEFLAKLHLGQMPDKIEIKEVFEAKFEQLEDISQTLYQQTTEAFSKSDSLKAHLALLYDERSESKKKYTEAYDDAVSLDTEITKLEDNGVSLLPYDNNGTDEEAKQLMDMQDLYDNAISVFRNEEMNYQIRENALVLCKFYRDVVKEIANTGRQAYDDIKLMVREMRNAIDNAMTCKEMMDSIKKSDTMIKILKGYVGDMTKTSLGYLGIVKDVRVGNGEIIPGSINDAIKNRYKTLGTARERRKDELKNASQRIFQNEK